MNAVERFCRNVRHAPGLEGLSSVWNLARPAYDRVLHSVLFPAGLERVINGTDRIRVSPRCRWIPENYEPEVWRRLMPELHPGDTFVDVGAHVGLYTMAAALRVGPSGRVMAFEPDPQSCALLRENVRLNALQGQITVEEAVVGRHAGSVRFLAGGESESRVATAAEAGADALTVRSLALDGSVLGRVAVLKVDVEGYEEEVLRGALGLLTSPERRPRAIFVEAHPYAWEAVGTTSESLLALLDGAGYTVTGADDREVHNLARWGEIIARPSKG